ncbi:probable protein phosphatase 2C 27 [Tanacetum coccineum]
MECSVTQEDNNLHGQHNDRLQSQYAPLLFDRMVENRKDFGLGNISLRLVTNGKNYFLPVIRSGSCAQKGPKQYMEDEHICIDNLLDLIDGTECLPSLGAFNGVFEGHGVPGLFRKSDSECFCVRKSGALKEVNDKLEKRVEELTWPFAVEESPKGGKGGERSHILSKYLESINGIATPSKYKKERPRSPSPRASMEFIELDLLSVADKPGTEGSKDINSYFLLFELNVNGAYSQPIDTGLNNG